MKFAPLSIFTAAIVATAGTSSVSADGCINPVFQANAEANFGKVAGFSGSITLSTSPATFPADAKMCSAFAGKPSCCSAATLTAIDTATTSMENALNAAENQWKNADFSALKAQLNLLCLGNDACKKQVTADFVEIKSKIDAIVATEVDCAHGMIGYTRGMICFACTTDFASFIVDNKLQIASNTCDALYSACSPVYGAYKDLIESMIAIIERFLKQYGLTLKIDWKADLCNGDCKDLICNTLVQGLASKSLSPSGSGGPFGRRLAIEKELRSLPQTKEADALRELVAFMDFVQQRSERFADSTSAAATPVRKLAQSNTYASTGYDAYSVGCKDYSSCPSSFPVGAVVAVVGVVAAAAIVAVAVRYMQGSKAAGNGAMGNQV